MSQAPAQFFSDVVDEHYGELAFLWAQRKAALRSPEMTLRNVLELDERIGAHLEGLLIGEDATALLVEPGLCGPAPETAFASAFTLLVLGKPEQDERVWRAFIEAEGPALAGLTDALCSRCPAIFAPRLVQVASGMPSAVAASAAEILAAISPNLVRPEWITALLQSDSPAARGAAWRVVASAGVALRQDLYEASLCGGDSEIANGCLEAAARTGQTWLLDRCRKLAEKEAAGHPAVTLGLARLGLPTDLKRMLYLASDTALGPQRFRWLGAYGHPDTLDLILTGCEARNLREAVAAGNAFAKITGIDVSSQTRVQLPPDNGESPDSFDAEFLDEACLPDGEKARGSLYKLRPNLGTAPRWCRGKNVGAELDTESMVGFDMESCWELSLRRSLEGKGVGGSWDKFPFAGARPGVGNRTPGKS